MASLLDAARTVRAIGAQAQEGKIRIPARRVAPSRALYAPNDPIASLDSTAKVQLLNRIEQLARAQDPRAA
mgnify:FL=1